MLRTKYRYIYITFSVPIKIELDNGKTTTHKLKFIDLCQAHYQALLIIYLKDFITKNVKNVSFVLSTYQSKIINQYANAQTVTKITNYISIKI